MEYSEDYNNIRVSDIWSVRDSLAHSLKWHRKALSRWYQEGCKDLKVHHALWEDYQRLKDIAKNQRYLQYYYEYIWSPPEEEVI